MNFRSSYFPTDEQFFNEQRQQLTREYATKDFSDATPSFGACQQQQQQQLSYLLGSRCSYSCYTQPAFDDREQNSESPLTTSNQSDSPVTTISRETGAPHSCVGNDESRKIYDQIPTASRSTSKVFGDSSEKIKLQKLADGSISSFCIQQIDELYDVKSHQSRQYQQQQQLLSSAIVHSVSDGVSVFDAPMVTTSAISSPSVIASTSVDPVSSFSAASNAANDDFRPVFLDYVTSPMTAVGEQLVATADGISSDLPPTCNRRRYSETEAMTPMTALQQTLPLAQLEAVLGRCSTDCHTSILPSPRLYQRLNHLAPPLTNQQPVRPLLLQTSCSIGNGAYHSATAGVRVKPEMQYDDDNEQGSVDAGCFGISASSIGIDFTQSFTRNGVVTTPSTRCRSNGSSTSFELSSEAVSKFRIC
jgi:hypothetical protein